MLYDSLSLFFFCGKCKSLWKREFPLNQIELYTMGNKKEKPGIAEKVENVKVEKVKM